MIGWVLILFFPAYFSVIAISLYNNRNKAVKECNTFERLLIEKNESLLMFLDNNSKGMKKMLDENILRKNAVFHVINKKGANVYINNINLDIDIKPFPTTKYNKLLIKLEGKSFSYDYSFDSYSIYYKNVLTENDVILRIKYPSANFKNE